MTDENKLQPTAPRYLTGQARSMYEAIVPLLSSRGTGKLSQSIVEAYCQTWQISRQAYDAIQAFGITNADGKKTGAVTTYESALKNLRGLASDLGLTPQAMVNLQRLVMDSDDEDGMTFEERAKSVKF